MKSMLRLVASFLAVQLLIVCNAIAQTGAPAGSEPAVGAPAGQVVMTHAKMARELCQRLGLMRFLPANPSDLDCMLILSQNGIYPSPTTQPTPENPTPGWNLAGNAPLTVAEMAVLMVRSMQLQGSVEGDKTNPESWMKVLRDYQIPMDGTQGALTSVKFLRDIDVAVPIFEITGDPLVARDAPEAGVLAILGGIRLSFITPKAIFTEQGQPPHDLTPT